MGGTTSNLHMFEGALKTNKEIAAIYTAVGKETLRRAVKDGCQSIADVNAWLAAREKSKRSAAKNGAIATYKNRRLL
jgi:hypothetical protein